MVLGVLQSGKIDDENFPFLFQITKCMLEPMKKCTNMNHDYFCNFPICLISLPSFPHKSHVIVLLLPTLIGQPLTQCKLAMLWLAYEAPELDKCPLHCSYNLEKGVIW